MTAGITINCSGGWQGDSKASIDIFNNTVEHNQNGIFLQQRNRGYSVDIPSRPWQVQNVKVHDNTVTVTARTGDVWGDNLSGIGAYEEPTAGTRRDFFIIGATCCKTIAITLMAFLPFGLVDQMALMAGIDMILPPIRGMDLIVAVHAK